ncbi:amino acid kinase family protein [Candidatus Trichorickettsia mobilis]|uniref:amino acid kinase family protein n=1 Tax=Candidatus Trichorickettsia mobilis TaxID=1346319 RepID=UPI00292E3F7C|nr:acetylglutamate kinase [Candidatus Trichorickettsia mobilis]
MQKNCSLVWNASDHKQKKAKNIANFTTSDMIKDIILRSSEIKDQVIVIKLPSIIITNDLLLTNFVENIRLINLCNARICIVHDHADLIGNTLKNCEFDEKFINSLKIIDHKSAQIIEMVLSGYINKLIVSKLCKVGCHAIGISGKDCNFIQARKSRFIYKQPASNNDIINIEFIGEPVTINPELLLSFEDRDIIPVISPIANDQNGCTTLLDVNLTAAAIAATLNADHLILPLTTTILGDKNLKVKDTQVLQNILLDDTHELEIRNLLQTAINALNDNIYCVHLIDAVLPDSIILSLLMDADSAI